MNKDYIMKLYNGYLEDVDEMDILEDLCLTCEQKHKMAVDWTIEDISSTVSSELDSYRSMG